ncbi:hypothetical protein C8R44DRAFT_763269, partial [Mycena epipterygia]
TFRPALRRVNRVGIPISSPIRSVPQLTQKRQYAASSPKPESPTATPEAPTAPKPIQFSYVRKKKPAPLLPLPAAPPEPLTTPLVESDFSEYLKPLYTRGWKLSACNMPVESGEETSRIGFVFRQTFRFPSTKDLVAFSENTRDMDGQILARKTLKESNIAVSLLSPELTRGQIHFAIAMETEHQKVAGSDFGVVPTPLLDWVRTPQRAQKILNDYRRAAPRFGELAPITPVALPPAPPAPVSSPPSITEADLETYIKPLVTNGWSVKKLSLSTPALRGHSALHRIYSFHDYSSARHFLNTVVAIMPGPTLPSYESVGLRLDSGKPVVAVWSLSELAEDAPKKYGISHTDVRFAIDVENEFAKNWAGRAENTAALTRTLPKTMEELWNGEGKVEL